MSRLPNIIDQPLPLQLMPKLRLVPFGPTYQRLHSRNVRPIMTRLQVLVKIFKRTREPKNRLVYLHSNNPLRFLQVPKYLAVKQPLQRDVLLVLIVFGKCRQELPQVLTLFVSQGVPRISREELVKYVLALAQTLGQFYGAAADLGLFQLLVVV